MIVIEVENLVLKIRLYGDPCLRERSIPLDDVGPGERMVFQSMIETMHQAKGVGLAAPQVGINRRFFVVDIDDDPMVIINPTIVEKKGSDSLEEGCLSIPQVTIVIKRPKQITVEYIDENGQPMVMTCDNLLARVIQHETDHLDGKMIVDYASKDEREKFAEQLTMLEEEQRK